MDEIFACYDEKVMTTRNVLEEVKIDRNSLAKNHKNIKKNQGK